MSTPTKTEGALTAKEHPRSFKFGWYGDNGLGEALIEKILSGEKTASMCPAYDPEEAAVGETLRIVDKADKTRAKIRILRIENRRFEDVGDDLAGILGADLDTILRITSFANSRPMSPDEEMRIVHFELIEVF